MKFPLSDGIETEISTVSLIRTIQIHAHDFADFFHQLLVPCSLTHECN